MTLACILYTQPITSYYHFLHAAYTLTTCVYVCLYNLHLTDFTSESQLAHAAPLRGITTSCHYGCKRRSDYIKSKIGRQADCELGKRRTPVQTYQ